MANLTAVRIKSEAPSPVLGDIWFRYTDRVVASWDSEYERVSSRGYRLDLQRLHVVKVTPKGVWLVPAYCRTPLKVNRDNAKFVLLHSNKHFACPTQEEALASFLARKQRQLDILQAQTERVLAAINLAQHKANPLETNEAIRLVEF